MLMVAIDVPDALREPRDILRCERDGTRVERVVIEDVARQDERVRRACEPRGPSVVVADGSGASSWVSANGAFGASGVVLDVFGSGDQLAR